MDYTDVIDRVVALPMALTWEPGQTSAKINGRVTDLLSRLQEKVE